MTDVVSEDGPQQSGTIDAATLAAAVKAGISVAPDVVVEDNKPLADPDALPSDADGDETIEDTPDRPEWLPEKFKTVEEMAAAYAELEKKQGVADPKAVVPPTDGTKPPDTAEGKQAGDLVTKAGLEWAKLNEEWTKDGKFSDATYTAFAGQGVSKELVDNYIKGQQAIGTASYNSIRDAAFEAAGGEKVYTDAIQWATTGLDAAAIKAFDNVVTGNDPAAVKMAVAGLVAKFKEAGGNEPANLATGGGGGANGGTYANMDQMLKDMADPRYAEDAAFRKKVEAKAGRSNF